MEAALDPWWLFLANSCLIWNLVLFCVLKRCRLLISLTLPRGIFVCYHMVCLFSVEREVKVVNICLPFLDTATFPLSTSVKSFFSSFFYRSEERR